MPTYVAFLRGINVGGHKPVPMHKLKEAFEGLGFTNVRTLLVSGNVVFEAAVTSSATLKKRIEEKLKKSFGFEIGTLIRTLGELRKLSRSQPFKGGTVTPQTRLYVTFLSEKPKGTLKIPYESADGHFRILFALPKEVCSVLTLSPTSRTADLMAVIEKEFGKNVTTRNWNTVERVLKMDENA